MKKYQITIFSLGLIATSLVVGVLVWGWKYDSGLFECVKSDKAVIKNVNINDVEEIDTFNWQTYRSEEYGFEFKYPSDWHRYNKQEKIEDGKYRYIYNIRKSDEVSFINKELINVGVGAPDTRFSTKKYDKDLNSYIEEIFDGCDEIKKLKIHDIEFIKLNCEGYADPNYYVGKRGNLIYTLYTNGGMNDYIDNVIQTLRFTKSIDEPNWLTYGNDNYGFEFIYPAKWNYVVQKDTKNLAFSTAYKNYKTGEEVYMMDYADMYVFFELDEKYLENKKDRNTGEEINYNSSNGKEFIVLTTIPAGQDALQPMMKFRAYFVKYDENYIEFSCLVDKYLRDDKKWIEVNSIEYCNLLIDKINFLDI